MADTEFLTLEERADKIYKEFYDEKRKVESSIAGIKKVLENSTREISKVMKPPESPKLPGID